MRHELRLHRVVLTVLTATTLAFIALLFYIHNSIGDARLEVVASLVLIVAAGGALLIIGGIEGAVAIEFGKRHIREAFGYLLLCLTSLSAGVYLGIAERATLQIISLIASLYAFIFGVAQMRMAQHLGHHPAYKRVFIFDGLIEILCHRVKIIE